MAFWHGRILPATVYFRRRGIVVITSENFDGEWIAGIIERFGYGTARGSTSRGGAQGAAAADARHGGGQAGRVHDRRAARPGARRAARRRVAGEDHRQPGRAVSYRGRPPLDARTAGTGRRFRSRLRFRRSRSASRCTSNRTPTPRRSKLSRARYSSSCRRSSSVRSRCCSARIVSQQDCRLHASSGRAGSAMRRAW